MLLNILFTFFIFFYFSVSLLANLPEDKLTKIVDCLEVVRTDLISILNILLN